VLCVPPHPPHVCIIHQRVGVSSWSVIRHLTSLRPWHGGGGGGGRQRAIVHRVREVEPLEVSPPAPPSSASYARAASCFVAKYPTVYVLLCDAITFARHGVAFLLRRFFDTPKKPLLPGF
jgi:hypothetical protein